MFLCRHRFFFLARSLREWIQVEDLAPAVRQRTLVPPQTLAPPCGAERGGCAQENACDAPNYILTYQNASLFDTMLAATAVPTAAIRDERGRNLCNESRGGVHGFCAPCAVGAGGEGTGYCNAGASGVYYSSSCDRCAHGCLRTIFLAWAALLTPMVGVVLQRDGDGAERPDQALPSADCAPPELRPRGERAAGQQPGPGAG